MSDSTDDEAYDYDETGRESDDYSDDFGDETDDDAVDRVTRAHQLRGLEEVPSFTHGASMATGADVSQAASSAAAATTTRLGVARRRLPPRRPPGNPPVRLIRSRFD